MGPYTCRSCSNSVTASTPSAARSDQISPTQDSASACEANRWPARSPVSVTSPPALSSSRHHHGRSAAGGWRNVGGCSGRFMSGLPDGRVEERRLGELEDLSTPADVDADLGVRVHERRQQREPDALAQG